LQTGAAVAGSSSLWQITEPLPMLSSEPGLAEALLADGQSLIELVNSVDTAINALLNGQQVRGTGAAGGGGEGEGVWKGRGMALKKSE
jgi:hypothetical protein